MADQLADTVPQQELDALVARALAEDVGPGDRSAALIPAAAQARARLVCREPAVLCGGAWFEAALHRLDPSVRITWEVAEGARIGAGQTLCRLEGPARAVLSGERTAINLLQTLSGTATATRRFVDAVAGTGVQILDSRKTIPGLRAAQKYAVRCGGGQNHRMGLYDGIMLKENHIQALGDLAEAVRAALASAAEMTPALPVTVEVENLAQARTALDAGAQWLLLDNFELSDLREAVALNAGRARLEASGGIDLDHVRAIAETGIDCISVGGLTKHLQALDLSLRFDSLD